MGTEHTSPVNEGRTQTFQDAAQPFCDRVDVHAAAASAMLIMRYQGCALLPVTAAEGGEFVGLVLLPALESSCRGGGHDPAFCEVGNHLVPGVETRYADEPVEGPAGTPGAGQAEFGWDDAAGSRPVLPVVVLDRRRTPVGYVVRSRDGRG